MSFHMSTEAESSAFQHLDVEWDKDEATLWCYMAPQPRPCFNPQLLSELIGLRGRLQRLGVSEATLRQQPSFAVFASRMPGVFNLGGDLGHGVLDRIVPEVEGLIATGLQFGLGNIKVPLLTRIV